MLSAGPGHSHETEFDVPRVRVAEDVDLAYLRGVARLSRTKEGILVQGDLHAGVESECIRCLDSIEQDVVISLEELYAYLSPKASEFSIGDDAILDLSPLLRAEAIIADTRGGLCRPDCRGLCADCGSNLNHDTCTCALDNIDPRLAKLRELLDK
ncbi:MAG: DUF177 domain-containing protein [Chloroflexi bacterium]|nr:DUF177 domain-containing protein [Chloroflexota bacterium]